MQMKTGNLIVWFTTLLSPDPPNISLTNRWIIVNFCFGETEAEKWELPTTLSSDGGYWASPIKGHTLSSSVVHWIQIKEM